LCDKKGMGIDAVMKTRYIGISTESSFDWKVPIKAISSKVSRAIEFLKHARNFQDTLKTLYEGIIEPHFP